MTTILDFFILLALAFGFVGFIIGGCLWLLVKFVISLYKRRG